LVYFQNFTLRNKPHSSRSRLERPKKENKNAKMASRAITDIAQKNKKLKKDKILTGQVAHTTGKHTTN
jgi:hypothetical protein